VLKFLAGMLESKNTSTTGSSKLPSYLAALHPDIQAREI
jgi:hypothetical protein